MMKDFGLGLGNLVNNAGGKLYNLGLEKVGWMREEFDALGEDITIEGLNEALRNIAMIDAAFRGWADNRVITVSGKSTLVGIQEV